MSWTALHPTGRQGLNRLVTVIADEGDQRLPSSVRSGLAMLVEQYHLVLSHLLETDRAIRAHSRASELSRRHPRIAAIALANKIGRIGWALMTSGEHYREPVAA